MGSLSTPPAGDVAQEMKAAQNYVIDMLHRLAGDEITESGIELAVEVFTGDIPQAAIDDSMRQERQWKTRHGEKPWPIREWMGVPDSAKKDPIYRMVVDLGMLRALETEDELAFVLAHQAERLLDHVVQDPENKNTEDPATKSFVDSRDMQVEADKAAIARMNKAGFNPRGALKAINTLYTLNPIDYPEDDLERALTAAAHNQEAEGMRVGMLQAEVEDYVRRGEPNVELEMKALPSHLKIEARSEYDKPVANIEEFKLDYSKLAQELATDESPGWMFRQGQPPAEYLRVQAAGGDHIDKEQALLAAAEHLSQLQDKTPQQKVDGMLRLMVSSNSRALPEKSFSDEGLQSLKEFFRTNGQDWDARKFVDTLKSGKRSLHFAFVNNQVFNENFQEFTAGVLPGLADVVPYAWVYRGEEEPDLTRIPSLIRKNYEEERDTLAFGGCHRQRRSESSVHHGFLSLDGGDRGERSEQRNRVCQ